MQVYSLVSSAKRHSPDFTQLSPGHRTCSFISHLNSPGAYSPAAIFRRTELFEHTSLHCPARYPVTPGSRDCHPLQPGSQHTACAETLAGEDGDCTCEQSALPRSTSSEHNYSAQPGIEPAISRLFVAHATTAPRRPTSLYKIRMDAIG